MDRDNISPSILFAIVVALLSIASARCYLSWDEIAISFKVVIPAAFLLLVIPALFSGFIEKLNKTVQVQFGLFVLFLIVYVTTQSVYDINRISQAVLAAIKNPYIMDPMEGREGVKAWLVYNGVNIYSDLSGYPYLVTLYGPIYYALLALALNVSHDVLLVGRLISLCSYLLLCSVCIVYSWTSVRSWFALAVLVLMFLGFPVLGWEYAVKPDMLAWLFAFAGLFLADASNIAGSSRSKVVLAGICFSISAFTKLQALAALIASVLSLAVRKKFSTILKLAVATIFVACFFLAAVQYVSDGLFLQQTVLFPAYFSNIPGFNGYDASWERFSAFLANQKWLVCIAVVSLFVRRIARVSLLLELSLLVFSGTAFHALKWYGSSSNNFIGVLLILYMLTADLLGRLYVRTLSGRAAITAVLLTIWAFPPSFTISKDVSNPNRETLIALRSLTMLTDKPLLSSTEAASPFIWQAGLEKLKLFDAFELAFYDGFSGFDFMASDIVRDIKQRRFGFIVDDRPVAPSAFKHLVWTFYKPHSRWGEITVFDECKGDILIVDSVDKTEDYGQSGLERVLASNVKTVGKYVTPDDSIDDATLQYKIHCSPDKQQLFLRYYPKISDADSSIEARVSKDGEHWSSWFTFQTMSGYYDQFWADNAETATTALTPGTLHIQFILKGTARLWIAPESPMAFRLEGR